jgi:phospho-N-acetylmuramoyl-pentapeptide-transferase
MKHVILVAVVTFVAGVLLYPALLTLLARVGAGQHVQEFNPGSHRVKAGTPTMGGILFCLIAVAAWLVFDRGRAGFVVVYALLAGAAVGLLDDLANVRGLSVLGLEVRQKLVLQAVVGVLVGFGVHAAGASAQNLPGFGLVDLGWTVVPLCAVAVVATSNAVNLTDGVDGLAASCVGIALVGTIAVGLQVHAPGPTLVAAALLGGVAAFLLYNWHPARVFMGDTGALALGAALTTICVEVRMLWLLPLLGIVFAVETASVVVNVTAITRFSRRIFRSSPLHHHFEELGIREERLVLLFSGAALVAMVLSVLFMHGVAGRPLSP